MVNPIIPCGSCGALVRWYQHVRTRRLAPIDAKPTPDGNVHINDDGTYMVDRHFDTPPRYTFHFATCPNAARHRRLGVWMGALGASIWWAAARLW